MDVVLTSTLKEIQKTLENPVQVSAPQGPNKPLWDMLKNIALAPDDRIAVGMHLCKLEFQVNLSFLISMGQEYLERWDTSIYLVMILQGTTKLLCELLLTR